jgi:glycosyltransferase involved in cell wall biosynthesis
MKILRIIARLNVGGPARHVVWLTKELQDDEFQTVLIAGTVPDGEEDMSYFAAENGVEPIYLKEMSRELSIRDLISIHKIYRYIRRESPDIVHTHTAKAGTVGRVAVFMYRWLTWSTLVLKPRNVRSVHTFHGHVFHSYYGRFKTAAFLRIEKLLARFATNKILAISSQQLNEINGKFGVGRKDQFSVIPLGIDTDSMVANESDRKAFREEVGATERDVLVGFVGRLTEIKDLSHLLRVAAMYNDLSRSAKPSIKFLIVGDGHLRESLQREAEGLGVLETVIFIGNRKDISTVYSGLDLVALTSKNEGTPLSLIEAMAADRAFISTEVGGVVDLLGDVREDAGGFKICERGIGVEPGSTESYLSAVLRLAENKQLREKMGHAGRDFVEKHYSKQRLVADIKELYRDLAGARAENSPVIDE